MAESKAGEHYREFGPAVYRCCLRILKDREAARDATQEVFLKLVCETRDLDDGATALRWMYRVARNHCLNLRRASHLRRAEDAGIDLELPADTSPDLCSDRLLAQAVLSLFDAATQAVVVAVILEGHGHEEVARALGVSCVTVARKVDRFLARALEYVSSGEQVPQAMSLGAAPPRPRSRRAAARGLHRTAAVRGPAPASTRLAGREV